MLVFSVISFILAAYALVYNYERPYITVSHSNFIIATVQAQEILHISTIEPPLPISTLSKYQMQFSYYFQHLYKTMRLGTIKNCYVH